MKVVNPETKTVQYSSIMRDTGYSSVCPCCGARFNVVSSLINKPREVHISRCDKCLGKQKTLYERNHSGLA